MESGKLGISSFEFYWAIQYLHLSAEQLIEKTAGLGLEVLQICDNLPLTGLSTRELDALRVFASSKSVDLEVGTRGFDQDELRLYIEIAQRLGSKILRFVPWSGDEELSRLSIESLFNFIQPLLKDFESFDVTLALENHAEIRDEDLVSLLNEINSPYVGICLDTCNSTGLLQKPMETVGLLAPFTISLHLKDFKVLKKAGKGYVISGIPLGQGWVDVPAVFAALEDQHKHPNILLEQWVDPCPSEPETLQKEEEWLRQSVEYVRRILQPEFRDKHG